LGGKRRAEAVRQLTPNKNHRVKQVLLKRSREKNDWHSNGETKKTNL